MPRKRSSGDGGLYYVASRDLWRGVLDVGHHPDGRRKQKIVTSRTQKGARDKLDLLRKEMDEFGAPLDKQTTVKDWADQWIETVCRPHMKPNGLAAYESVTRRWIIPTLGRKKVALLKPSDVRLVMKRLFDADMSSSTARKTYNVLKLMLEAARREGLIARNVATDVVPPKMAVSERGALPTADALKVLGQAWQDGDAMWQVAITGGLRQSERLGATIESFNPAKGELNVEWALDEVASEHGCTKTDTGWTCGKKRGASCPQGRLKVPYGFEYRHLTGRLCLVRPKSGHTRTVPLLPEVAAAVQTHIELHAHEPNPYGLIWRRPDGSPLLPHEDEAAWRDALFRAGLITSEQIGPGSTAPTSHSARHTTATVLMELGVDPKIVGVIVGHQSEAVTRKYQHVMEGVAREAVTLMGARFAEAFRPIEG